MPHTTPFAEPIRATTNRRLTIRYAAGAHAEANIGSHHLSPFQKVRIRDVSAGAKRKLPD